MAPPQPVQSTSAPPQLDAVPRPSATTCPSDDDTRRRVSKKLQKKRQAPHSPTMELPDRLKESTDGADDEEDVRVPPQGGGMFMNMNQSIFGLIAAAGSTVDFNDRFEGQSSDDEDEDDNDDAHLDGHSLSKKSKGKEGGLAHTTVLKGDKDSGEGSSSRKHRRKLSERRLLRSLPSLTTRFSSKHRKESKLKAPQIREEEEPESPYEDSPSIELTRASSRLAPVMSRMLEAKAEMAARPSFDLDRRSGEKSREGHADAGPSPLALKLMEIFHFAKPEEVIEEYPCWLLQSVLLQGYMYITAKHICFYAYLPKKAVRLTSSLPSSGPR
jgi:sterol 3beta-glucosyltransferase